MEARSGNLISVSPRDGSLRTDENFIFELQYKVPLREHVRRVEWWGLYDFTFTMMSNLQWIAKELIFTIVLPKGMELEAVSENPVRRISSIYDTTLLYNLTGITPFHDLTFTMKYKYQTVWTGLTPLVWVILIEIVVLSAAALAKLRRKQEPHVPIPIETIRKFVRLYDERTAAEDELESLDEEVARRRLSKHEYRRRTRAIELRLGELNRMLAPVREGLRPIQARYDEMISRIERSEAEIEAIRASEKQIRDQYRTGKIGREAYQDVKTDLRRRRERAKQTIDGTIIVLREEAR